MDYISLSRISLKHLTVLHVLLTTTSVTCTAQQLCVTPSCVSKILAQLRALLKDELFYREGTQLIATPYALSIAPVVHGILASMNGVIHQGTFQPESYSGAFSLAMRESTFEVFAPLFSEILSQTPQVNMSIYAKEQHGFDSLLRGQVDFLLLPHDISQPPTMNKELVWQAILDDEMVCLMNSAHPLVGENLTIGSYLACQHIGIHEKELAIPYFEHILTQCHQPRDIVISLADFGAAAVMCHHSPLLFTCSKRWAETALQAKGLVQKALPFDYGQVAYSLVYNKQSLNDPALVWLKQRLTEMV
ncbi:LysR family transcriptional regulator [Vibrio navarrensis]|uniref:LysR family transcriptional regulator n=1 Tax=Vibrio navarrensis TaxID=29495 RepID=A0A099MKD7_9VIBR|nr:LysR family transcriptional regulator [Vibrio navarrensis]EGR2795561.1 LysR family transcriptional regulator [Vibrio navarrensis]EHA1126231.1 LysR family transcriptional regulator [Vibrio navarrensis]EJK2113600.1 LysR family transcriptional regulator [Vibrio navarrensis]EJL6395119.1 LysR family transcriptional regulator [Vibrio navarrensis]EJL6400090.1 LysR family transcriptional regulator [Vibrio navarrensis]